jgi:hypothetical protein
VRWLGRIVRAFGRFWWDFLVGDTPELFVAALVTIGVVAIVSSMWGLHQLSVVVLPALVASALAWSLRRALRP